MANANDRPRDLEWTWSDGERQRLLSRFQTALHALLRAYESWRPGDEAQRRTVAADLAGRIEKAGIDLDICASNCHVLANTLRAQAGLDGVQAATPHAAVRLSKALGCSAVLTRTTIEQLAGRLVTLAYLEGANAIVRLGEEYWGTPIDRLLVVPATPPATTADDDRSGDPSPAEPAFRFRLSRGELSNAIQFLTMTARSGVLTVSADGPGGHAGSLTVAGGRVVCAIFDDCAGVDAVARMMTLSHSTATFADGAQGAERNLNLATDQLLIEAAVRADELNP